MAARNTGGSELDRWLGVLLGVLAAALYLNVGPGQADTDSHYFLAQAFLDGRLYLIGDYPWLELVPRAEGGWYSPFPPLLAVALTPFAAAGITVDTDQIAAVMGGISVALMWTMLARLGVVFRSRVALTVAWAIGSQLLWMAGTGGQHLAPQVTAAALLIAAITLGLDRRWPFVAGLLLVAAASARLPVGLALPLLLWLYRPQGDDRSVRSGQPWVWVVAAMAIPMVLVALYNQVRFDGVFEFGYGLIENVQGESVLDEFWYPDGIVSLSYLPFGLYAMLFQGFDVMDGFPWIFGDWAGTSILLTMPILWWVFEARGRLALVAGAAVVLVMIPNLLHGNPGFAQIGYRFILDALPMLWLLLGLAFLTSMGRAARAALIAGIAVNIWMVAVRWGGYIP